MQNTQYQIFLCGGTGCIAGGNLKIKALFEQEIAKHNINAQITLTGCNGFCAQGPVLTVKPDEVFYQKVTIKDVPEIVQKHLIEKTPVERLLFKDIASKKSISNPKEIPFFKLQTLRVLRNKGLINPESIDDYLAVDGYKALKKAVLQMSSQEIIDEIIRSGLRGRGGGGFLTGKKWQVCKDTPSDEKFVICNRSVIEIEPHAIIEGMTICAKAVGAKQGYVFIRAGSPILIQRMQTAIKQALDKGFLGTNILGSDFSFHLEIAMSPDEFVCGEETSLITSIESKRGMPNPKPFYPAERGLWGKPTVVNTVETHATVPLIILHGAEWFKSVGTASSPGTKIFTLSGPLNSAGVVEVPLGTTIRSVINDIAGGIQKGRTLKAVQIGGSTGGYLPETLLDTPLTYEDITKVGAIIGSGGIAVMSDLNCIVSAVKFIFDFASDESCGKCPPCRIGTTIIKDMLTNITEGKAQISDIQLLKDLAEDIKKTSLCGLGQTAMCPLLTSIKYFYKEYEEHINEKWCKAGICRDLVTFHIIADKCKACGACKRACPNNAVVGYKKTPHWIDQSKCIQCRSCYLACKFSAIEILSREMRDKLEPNPPEPPAPEPTKEKPKEAVSNA